MRYLGYADLPGYGIKYSKPHIWRLRKLPAGDPRKFPDPIKGLAAGDIFREDEIIAYREARDAERDANAA